MSTRITLHEDQATGISAVSLKANINGMAFNLDYITDRDPRLAQKLIELYDLARSLPKEKSRAIK